MMGLFDVAKMMRPWSYERISRQWAVTPLGLSGLLVWSLVAAPSEARGQATAAPPLHGRASVSVRVRAAQPDLALTVYVESTRSGGSDVLAPGAEPVLIKKGLHFGTYFVSATQGDDLVTAIASVVLDVAHPTAEVDLELGESRSALVLAGPDWNPVSRATVRPMRAGGPPFLRTNWDLTESQPGLYLLERLRPGTPLMIHADGFVPVCRVVQRHGTDVVLLELGRRVEVQFPRDITPAVAAELAALDDVPGSNCPVPLSAFRPKAATAGDLPVYRIDHFHSSYRFLLQRPGLLTRQVVVPDSGAVIVEEP